MSHAGDFLPRREAELVTWGANFAQLIVASPETYGLTLDQAQAFDVAFDEFRTAYNVANNNMTRSPANIEIKNEKKSAMKAMARTLARQIQGMPFVTNAQKLELGLNVKGEPQPVPPPEFAPEMDIFAIIGRTVKFRLHNEQALGHRGKPHGIKGASVFSYVGETAPDNLDDWHFEGNTSRTIIDTEFPVTVPPGSKVFLTAFWFNAKMQSGPACQPQGVNLAGGVQKAA